MIVRLWPRSLAARTALVLLLGLVLAQAAGLAIHALDRSDLQRSAQAHDAMVRIMAVYRSVVLAPPAGRLAVVGEFDKREDTDARLSEEPPLLAMPDMPLSVQHQLHAAALVVPVPVPLLPRALVGLGGPDSDHITVGMRLPEGDWLNVTMALPPVRPWQSLTFLAAFAMMTLTAGGLTLWAVLRLTAPAATLAAAAEALGRDVNAPPLPEDGPTEIAAAARAFNTMAARIRRFVEDRTFMLTAIGHDLRTPITRLKLRVEFLEDDDLRVRMLADLDELEAMVSATLAFGRDVATEEPVSAVDLAELVRTVLDEAADARPEQVDRLRYDGPDHLTVRVRSLAMKRALSNLVLNALCYGGSAHVRLVHASACGQIVLTVDDAGPGLPAAETELMFQPFHRGEASRNRETGGNGLGLPIARNILRAHGGDVTLANRAEGGMRATVTLPV